MSAPKLQDRLQRLADLIGRHCPNSACHADIGSDHGLLLRYLLVHSIAHKGIAGELRQLPLLNSQNQLLGLSCDVRLGNGLEVLRPREATSLSISGMGGPTIVSILTRHPEHLPDWVFLQANSKQTTVRRWAYDSKFHLVEEVWTEKDFQLLAFRRANSTDPAYAEFQASEDLLLAAQEFGPQFLLGRNQKLMKRLRAETKYFGEMRMLEAQSTQRLRLIHTALHWLADDR